MSEREPHKLEMILLLGKPPRGGLAPADMGDFARKVLVVEDVDSAVNQLNRNRTDLVIVNGTVPEGEALRLLKQISLCLAKVPVVVVAERPSVDQAVKFVRSGALDYFPGPLERGHLTKLLVGMEAERSRKGDGEDRFFSPACPPGVAMVGRSEGIVKALETIRIVAESRCNPVLILGETGTGKELAARAVHTWRCGDAERFVAVNCAALTANLLESELFGHVKGAFTGADRDKTGLFALAGEGTIFLDEISEMPPDLQAKLLRVLQERTFRKVGGTQDLSCDATVIASSNRDLLEEMRTGKFRGDLYYRLAVFPITIPPLRSPQRRADIPILAEYFLEHSTIAGAAKVKAFGKEALDMLVRHSWPGNVRELKNVVDRALILGRSEQVGPDELIIETYAEGVSQGGTARKQGVGTSDFSLETAEREFILRALQETGWQRTRAAALLGITRATLHAKLKRYGIAPPGERSSPERSLSDSRIQKSSI